MSYRLSRDTLSHYTSFEDLYKSLHNGESLERKTKDKEKLKSQQEKFCGTYKCKTCGQPMTYIGGNVMSCCNDACKGIKHEKMRDDGSKYIYYTPSFRILNDEASLIAENIF